MPKKVKKEHKCKRISCTGSWLQRILMFHDGFFYSKGCLEESSDHQKKFFAVEIVDLSAVHNSVSRRFGVQGSG